MAANLDAARAPSVTVQDMAAHIQLPARPPCPSSARARRGLQLPDSDADALEQSTCPKVSFERLQRRESVMSLESSSSASDDSSLSSLDLGLDLGLDELPSPVDTKHGMRYPYYRKGKLRWRSTPPRPMNAFLLYRKAMGAKIRTIDPTISMTELSHKISNMWAGEEPAVKTQYRKQSEAIREAHARLYPNFQYRSNRRKPAEHKLGVATTVAAAKHAVPRPRAPPPSPQQPQSLSSALLQPWADLCAFLLPSAPTAPPKTQFRASLPPAVPLVPSGTQRAPMKPIVAPQTAPQWPQPPITSRICGIRDSLPTQLPSTAGELEKSLVCGSLLEATEADVSAPVDFTRLRWDAETLLDGLAPDHLLFGADASQPCGASALLADSGTPFSDLLSRDMFDGIFS